MILRVSTASRNGASPVAQGRVAGIRELMGTTSSVEDAETAEQLNGFETRPTRPASYSNSSVLAILLGSGDRQIPDLSLNSWSICACANSGVGPTIRSASSDTGVYGDCESSPASTVIALSSRISTFRRTATTSNWMLRSSPCERVTLTVSSSMRWKLSS